MKRFAHLVLILGAVLVFTLTNGAVAADAKDLCRATSQKAMRSCEAEAWSDYWLARGKCHNLSDPAAREACAQQAEVDRKDALEECNDQRDARQAVCDRLGEDPYDPVIDPANFVATIDNPYMPLTPGTTFIYEGNTAEGFEHQEFAVTSNTRVILGVTCVEVHDTVTLDGALIEDTLDWFAQDLQGNVWYFGENSKRLSTARSSAWRAPGRRAWTAPSRGSSWKPTPPSAISTARSSTWARPRTSGKCLA